MSTIASPQNPRLKALRRLQRRRERERSGAFLAEGEDLIAAARLRPALAEQYAAVEREIGHRFRADLSMAEIISAAERPGPECTAGTRRCPEAAGVAA